MLSKQIEGAQKKVEEQNFLIRKRVLEYDDVMNQQREIIYEYRDKILEGEDMSETARDQLARRRRADGRRVPRGRLPRELGPRRPLHPARADVPGRDRLRGPRRQQRSTRQSLIDELREDIVDAYDDREEELGDELMRALERFMLLQIIDERWREHLHDMDYLREGIHLRGFAQIDPLVAYKNEGFDMFTGLMNSIWEEFGALHLRRRGRGRGPERRPAAAGQLGRRRQHQLHVRLLLRRRHRRGPAERAGRGRAAAAACPTRSRTRPTYAADEVEVPLIVEQRTVDEKERIGRNDPCWCGSGKKFKKCHGA